MNRRCILSISAMTALGLALLPGSALAQQKSLKEQLTGTWTLVSNDNFAPDGTKRQVRGPNPKGVLVLSPDGRHIQIITNPDIPRFKVNNRFEGTPEEYKTALQGTIANFGHWSVDEASKTLTRHHEGSNFPNQVGNDEKVSVLLTADEMKFSSPNRGAGGRTENVWKREPDSHAKNVRATSRPTPLRLRC